MHSTNKVVKKVNRNPEKPNKSKLSKQWHSVIEMQSNCCITDGKECLFFANIKWYVSEYRHMDILLGNALSSFCVLQHAITLKH
jgi:hypothetical protein